MKDWNEMSDTEKLSCAGWSVTAVFFLMLLLTIVLAARGSVFSIATSLVALVSYQMMESTKTRMVLASELIRAGK